MLLDLLDRCSGRWPHNSMVRSPAAPSPIPFVIFRFGATMELGRSGRSMMMMTSASASGGDGGVAGSLSEVQRPTGSSTAIAKFCSTDGSSMSSSLSRFSGWRSRSLSLGEGLTDSTGARDGTRADGVLDRGRRRLFSF